MAGLVPAEHLSKRTYLLNAAQTQRRGWPGHKGVHARLRRAAARPRRGECRSLQRLVLHAPTRRV